MKTNPSVIQLSQFKLPTRGKGLPYTVDFGIAKPLYKQLLDKWADALFSNRLFILGAVAVLYISFLLSLVPTSRIVYADPRAPMVSYARIEPITPLTMPVLSAVEAVSALPLPITPSAPAYSLANLYAPGNCTWYVASRLPVPSDWGNAISWGAVAAAQGYTVSDIPRVGAIAWSVTDSYLGHVALVESVTDVVTISEMNYQGLGVIDNRVANPGEFRYIYL